VEMTVNVRALDIAGQKNVVLHMDSLILHDRYGAGVSGNLYMEDISNANLFCNSCLQML
jgi:hypothetical protein